MVWALITACPSVKRSGRLGSSVIGSIQSHSKSLLRGERKTSKNKSEHEARKKVSKVVCNIPCIEEKQKKKFLKYALFIFWPNAGVETGLGSAAMARSSACGSTPYCTFRSLWGALTCLSLRIKQVRLSKYDFLFNACSMHFKAPRGQDIVLPPSWPCMLGIIPKHPEGRPGTTRSGHIFQGQNEESTVVAFRQNIDRFDASSCFLLRRLPCREFVKMAHKIKQTIVARMQVFRFFWCVAQPRNWGSFQSRGMPRNCFCFQFSQPCVHLERCWSILIQWFSKKHCGAKKGQRGIPGDYTSSAAFDTFWYIVPSLSKDFAKIC